MQQEIIPAHSLEAEEAVLGACMVDRDAASAVIAIVQPADFYAHVHETIFATLCELHAADKPLGKIAVGAALHERKQLENVGGHSYLTRLVEGSFQTISSAEYYARLVREKAVLRRLLLAAHKIAQIAQNGEVDVSGALAQAEAELQRASLGFCAADSGGHLRDLVARVWRQIDRSTTQRLLPQETPWRGLDALTGGWYGGELVAWFGRPKDGKSSAITQLIVDVAQRYGLVVLFALEMGEDSVVRRLLGNRAHIPSRRLRRGSLVGTDWDRLGTAMSDLAELPVYISSGARSVNAMRRLLLSLRAHAPVKAFAVDYLGCMDDVLHGEKNSTEHDRLNRTALRILNLAREFDCVAHVVTHANRAGYDQEPTMKHIRGGGNLEGHAHTIVAPYRNNPESAPTAGKFLVLANREGPTGAIEMHFDGPRNTWTEVAPMEGAA